jgi:4'-phosphopantetheinyl transferase EntD
LNSNPAHLCAQLAALFPSGTAAAELRAPGDPLLLLPAEAGSLGRAVPKRIQEFAAGRLCARRVLQVLGIEGYALGVAADRQPLWPQHIVGSITHTQGFCAAVAAERTLLAAIGLDSEIVGHVTRGLWPKICVEEELAWIAALPHTLQDRAVTVLFSAKEAFYKCQYPLVGEWLEFHDVAISVESDLHGEEGTFSVRATRAIDFSQRAALPMLGRYRFHQEFLTAAVALAA